MSKQQITQLRNRHTQLSKDSDALTEENQLLSKDIHQASDNEQLERMKSIKASQELAQYQKQLQDLNHKYEVTSKQLQSTKDSINAKNNQLIENAAVESSTSNNLTQQVEDEVSTLLLGRIDALNNNQDEV